MGSCDSNCFWFTFDPTSNPTPSVAYRYDDIKNNRDLWIAYLGVTVFGFFQWTSDANNNFFPDEIADDLNEPVSSIVFISIDVPPTAAPTGSPTRCPSTQPTSAPTSKPTVSVR